MFMLPAIHEIPRARVALVGHPFRRFAEGEDLTRLQESLAAVSLLAYPWVRSLESGRYRPVTGWRRLQAAARLGWQEVPALILPPETPETHLLLLYLHDNAFTRPFNPLEQALLASRLLNYWDRHTLVAKGLPLLGLPPAPAHLHRLLAVASLEDPWQELVAKERLALTAAARLAAWDPAHRLAALPFLANLPMSQSKQEEFLAAVEILARREGVALSAILQRAELQQCLQDPASNPQERAGAVRCRLNDWVSPRFQAVRQAFLAGLDRLGLRHHPRLRLKEPPAFEGPDFELSLKFRDHQELRHLLDELARLSGSPEFATLIDLV
jgi:ParB-like chromosome segregation protein Spo0J